VAWEFVSVLAVGEQSTELGWKWRRLADDTRAVLEESEPLPDFAACIDDARKNGFHDSTLKTPKARPGAGSGGGRQPQFRHQPP